jgi:hypothetical protein
MFGKLPPDSLGWLLVDEAGQAVPLAALGALLRTRRAVIVGDPMQLEPVVQLPERLTRAVCESLGVDADRYAAPVVSVRTLANAASAYACELQTELGSRRVGVPLLVHRRCAEPMFSMANTLANANQMVYAKQRKRSAIQEVLGSSR